MSSDPIEVASFFLQLENLFATFEIPTDLQPTLVRPYFNDKEKIVVSRLESNLADDYKKLKEAILREFKTTHAYLLNRFQNMCKDPGETHILYGSKLRTVLKYYMDSRKIDKDFKELPELLICDRIKAGLDDACLKHILTLENSATDGWLRLTDLTTSIDRYYANCVSGPKKVSVVPSIPGVVKRDGQLSTPNSWSPGTSGHKSQNNSYGRKPQHGLVRRCHECDSPDHIRPLCPRLSNHRLNGSSSHVLTATSRSYGKAKNSTPTESKPPNLIEIKFGTVNYVGEATPGAKYHANPSMGGFSANG